MIVRFEGEIEFQKLEREICHYLSTNTIEMIIDRIGLAMKTTVSIVVKRNFGTSYAFCAKAVDPVQQLFLDKIAEFKLKINDKDFVKQYPQLQKELDDELMRVTRQYGGSKPEDFAQLPPPKLDDPTVDHQPGF